MKFYETPHAELILLDVEDVITTSILYEDEPGLYDGLGESC